jgi:signal peptidase I
LAQQHRFLRALYWGAWFGLLPLALSFAVVWALTPPLGVDHGSFMGSIEAYAREQQIPVGIVVFTLFEVAFWAARHFLPLARFAYPPLRTEIPARCRPTYERADALLNEAEVLLDRFDKAITRELSVHDRDQLKEDLSALRLAMDQSPFDEDAFNEAWVRADGQVDVRLRPWRKSEVREYIESILVAVIVALGLRALVVEAFKIPSGSMIPTLQVGDHIFVNKFIYGPAIPFTHSRLWTHMPPERGDVIVHAYPENMEQDFIKRVIAVPGDTLEARNGHPWINGWEVPHCLVGVYSYDDKNTENEIPGPPQRHEGDLFVEYLGDKSYLTLYDHGMTGYSDHQGPFKAKPGEVWVMGDNRNNSHDSRMWWNYKGGGVPFENIRGRALFVWLSTFDGKYDWSRVGTPVMGRPRLPADMANLEPSMEKCFRDRPPIALTTPPPPSASQGQVSERDDAAGEARTP